MPGYAIVVFQYMSHGENRWRLSQQHSPNPKQILTHIKGPYTKPFGAYWLHLGQACGEYRSSGVDLHGLGGLTLY